MKVFGLWIALGVGAVGSAVCSAQQPTSFAVSFPAALSSTPLDGRVILLLSRDLKREPRSHVAPDEPLDSPYIFGLNVDSLAPASGLEFALLPPDNATGNFTKIVQRVPVKIVLDDQSLNGLLRPGMSAVPTVNTKSAAVAEREAEKRLASRGP